METISSDLRSTTPQSQRAQNVRRADPIRVLIDKDRLARFWFLAVITVLVGAAVERIHLARTLKERERVVIVDPGRNVFRLSAPSISGNEAITCRTKHTGCSCIPGTQSKGLRSSRAAQADVSQTCAREGAWRMDV